jgi:fused signal recognition particle receptor
MVTSFFGKIKSALSKTTSKFSDSMSRIFNSNKIDKEELELLEESLLSVDFGSAYTDKIINSIKKSKTQDIKSELISLIHNTLKISEKNFTLSPKKPHVILMCGVNGNGKTTTSAKLANYFIKQNLDVMLVACDTFRAGAVDQLKDWAARINCPIFVGEANSDPASVAYKALERAKEESRDVLIIDTAGRLQNQTNLMQELGKISKVLRKIDEDICITNILVLDATTGQNAINQIEEFGYASSLDGLIVTKLDGSSKCGILVSITDKFKIPVYFIGIGEGIEDLRVFNSEDFANALFQ